MSDKTVQKCTYHNSGYCKYTKKLGGCRYTHSNLVCTDTKCSMKTCPNRHPKTCRYGDKCKYGTDCGYSHTNMLSDQLKVIQIQSKTYLDQIDMLKTEIHKLKKDVSEKTKELKNKENKTVDLVDKLDKGNQCKSDTNEEFNKIRKDFEILKVRFDKLNIVAKNMKVENASMKAKKCSWCHMSPEDKM
jgi:hypothetical protein